MDKLKVTPQNLGRASNSESGCVHASHAIILQLSKWAKLRLKTLTKQLLGYCSRYRTLHLREMWIHASYLFQYL